MTISLITNAELDAYALLVAAGITSMNTEDKINSVREAANKIILLAEQIKAERSCVDKIILLAEQIKAERSCVGMGTSVTI